MIPLAFLTQHSKQSAVQVPLAAAGYAVYTVEGVDTDTLGTFTGETARRGSQLEAATAKARLAADLGGVRYGLGSEGSFGPDPYVGLSAWTRELLVCWDAREQRAVAALAQGAATNYAQTTARSWEQARTFAMEIGFPGHGIIVGKPGTPYFDKDCSDGSSLQRAVERALTDAPVWLETDMRAHRNPTRMTMITRSAQELARLLNSPCPGCQRPGFGEDSHIPGAVCESCGATTSALRAKRTTCNACGYAQEVLLHATVSAARCGFCNP